MTTHHNRIEIFEYFFNDISFSHIHFFFFFSLVNNIVYFDCLLLGNIALQNLNFCIATPLSWLSTIHKKYINNQRPQFVCRTHGLSNQKFHSKTKTIKLNIYKQKKNTDIKSEYQRETSATMCVLFFVLKNIYEKKKLIIYIEMPFADFPRTEMKI